MEESRRRQEREKTDLGGGRNPDSEREKDEWPSIYFFTRLRYFWMENRGRREEKEKGNLCTQCKQSWQPEKVIASHQKAKQSPGKWV